MKRVLAVLLIAVVSTLGLASSTEAAIPDCIDTMYDCWDTMEAFSYWDCSFHLQGYTGVKWATCECATGEEDPYEIIWSDFCVMEI